MRFKLLGASILRQVVSRGGRTALACTAVSVVAFPRKAHAEAALIPTTIPQTSKEPTKAVRNSDLVLNRPEPSTLEAVVRKVKNGFRYLGRLLQYVLYGVPAAALIPMASIIGGRTEEWIWNYLIWSIERLGPTFIKFAQWMSSRPDKFPPRLIERLQRLQDDVTTYHSMSTVENTLTDAFGDDWKSRLSLDPKPLGAGCVAQVFKGSLKDHSGHSQPVAVKLIHPFVESLIETDMELLHILADFMDKFETLELLSLGDTCRQFATMMHDQLDLRKEAFNLKKFTSKFKEEKWAVFPTPIDNFVTKHVLVETFMEGTPLKHLMDYKGEMTEKMQNLKLKLADLGARAIIKMVFFDNFVHGDLHPGNVMYRLLPNGEPQFVFLDCGLVFRSQTERDHQALFDICFAFMKHDGYTAGKLMVDNAKGYTVGDTDGFCRGIQKIVTDSEHELFYEHFGEYLEKVCSYARTYHVKLDPNYFHLAMILKVGEGIALSLNREIDMITKCIPIIVKAKTLQKLGIQKFPLPGEDDDI